MSVRGVHDVRGARPPRPAALSDGRPLAGRRRHAHTLPSQIAASELRKPNFRMFLVIYADNASGVARQSLLGRCNVISVDEHYTLRGWLTYCYNTIAPQALHEKLESVSAAGAGACERR